MVTDNDRLNWQRMQEVLDRVVAQMDSGDLHYFEGSRIFGEAHSGYCVYLPSLRPQPFTYSDMEIENLEPQLLKAIRFEISEKVKPTGMLTE